MILPTKGITAERSLLAVGAQVVQVLNEPLTVSQTWVQLKQWRIANNHHASIPFWWFALALDTLFALGLVEFDRDLLSKVSPHA